MLLLLGLTVPAAKLRRVAEPSKGSGSPSKSTAAAAEQDFFAKIASKRGNTDDDDGPDEDDSWED